MYMFLDRGKHWLKPYREKLMNIDLRYIFRNFLMKKEKNN